MIRSRVSAKLGLLGLVSLLVLAACGTSSAGGASNAPNASAKPAGPPPAPVSTTQAQTGPITAGISFTGDVTASQQVNLAPKVAGLVTKLMADVGSHVKAGQQIAELDHVTQDAAVAQAQAQLEVAQAKLADNPQEIAKAQATLAQQQANLSNIQKGRPEAVQQAQSKVDADKQQVAGDQAALQTAQSKLNLQLSPQQQDAFKQAVATARNTLYSNQIARDASCAGIGNAPPPATGKGSTCQAAQAAVNAAQTALDQANDTLAINVDPNTVAQLQNSVASAQATLDKDTATMNADIQAMAQVQVPGSPSQIAAAQALVGNAAANAQEVATDQSAQANVDVAQSNLQVAVVNQQLTQVTAPFDGVVSARLLSEGALSTTTVPIFTIISDNVEIDLPVAQEQLGQIKEGQAAQLTTPAYAGQTIDGKIAAISPAADPRSRTFLVRIVPVTQDGRLKPGMSVAVLIATITKNDALLIPRDAVTTDPNTNAQGVYVVQNGPQGSVAVFKTVTFGVTDGKNIEVVNGLNPGDLVIVSGQTAITNNQRVRLADSSGGQSGGDQGAAGASGKPQGSGKPQASGAAQSSAGGQPSGS